MRSDYFCNTMKRIAWIALLFALFFALVYCTGKKSNPNTLLYKNWADTVRYVGMSACLQCHGNTHQSFLHTGMGESWGLASRKKSAAPPGLHAVIYNAAKNFYYKPYWRNDSTLAILEFRLKNGDTVYRRTQDIKYIVGSGQHTNSHIWSSNGYLYQAPLTFYTQQQVWDLPPGFEDDNSRWNRIISSECMNCHNMYPGFQFTSENKYQTVPGGIECERCHGPGALHVKGIQDGVLMDTAHGMDDRIVNPRKLSRDRQMDLCQRCHMQWITVLNEGKTYFDYKPGMYLRDVMNYFIPRVTNGQHTFRMAAHADQLKQSACYRNSQMTCLTCHNPHVSVLETPATVFDAACQRCHQEPKHQNPQSMAGKTCYSCHMPLSYASDIPHVQIHDHRIQIPGTASSGDTTHTFLRLECTTNDHPDALLMAKGYLTAYDGWARRSYLLDSAHAFLLKAGMDSLRNKQAWIWYHYLRKSYGEIRALCNSIPPEAWKDAYTSYRIGDAFFRAQQYSVAETYYRQAVKALPGKLEFSNQLGYDLALQNKTAAANQLFEQLLHDDPSFAAPYANLGLLSLGLNEADKAVSYFQSALALDPDQEVSLFYLATIYARQKKLLPARTLLLHLLELNPAHEPAKQLLQQLG